MGADVADAATLARLAGVGAPAGIVAALQLDALREPTLRVLDINAAQLAQLTLGYARFHLLDGRIARIGVGESEREARPLHLFLQLQSLFQREGHRFVQHDVEPEVERQSGLLVMHLIGRHDGHEVHTLPFGKGGLFLQHLFVVVIDALAGDVPSQSRRERGLVVAAEATTNEFDIVFHQCCAQMDGAYHGVSSAANHAHSQFPFCHDSIINC